MRQSSTPSHRSIQGKPGATCYPFRSMRLLLLHGDGGAWDELLIAFVAFAVMWIAVKLAGRKPAAEDEDEPAADEAGIEAEHRDPVAPRAAKLG